jgi:hypothetical protein
MIFEVIFIKRKDEFILAGIWPWVGGEKKGNFEKAALNLVGIWNQKVQS